MTTPRPVFAKTIKPPVRVPARDDDYEKEAACSTCHCVDCICGELDSDDYMRRYQGL